MKRFFA